MATDNVTGVEKLSEDAPSVTREGGSSEVVFDDPALDNIREEIGPDHPKNLAETEYGNQEICDLQIKTIDGVRMMATDKTGKTHVGPIEVIATQLGLTIEELSAKITEGPGSGGLTAEDIGCGYSKPLYEKKNGEGSGTKPRIPPEEPPVDPEEPPVEPPVPPEEPPVDPEAPPEGEPPPV